jgi:hypothetical protein
LRVAALRFAAAAAIAVVALAAPAAAQEQPAPAPDTTVAATTTTVPAGCSASLTLSAEFVGKVVAGDSRVARFQVLEVRQGTLPGSVVDVDYGDNDDRRFVEQGKTYVVAVAVDPESTRLVSKVRIPRAEAKGCAHYDPIYTNNANGSHIDSSVLSGLNGKWGDMAMAFLIPTAAVFAVLLGLVILKHTFLLTGRGVRYARARHRSRPSRPAGRPPRAGAPPRERRTRTHSAPPSPG